MTHCSAFWNHTNIRSGNRVFPCCRFKTPVTEFTGNVSQILFHPNYEELRNKSSNGEYIEGCAKCYYEESLGKHSLRQKFNEAYTTTTVSLQDLEIGFDNICNLTCDGCFPEFSSAWGQKLNTDQPKKFAISSTVDFSNIPENLRKITFLGGEPLMTNRHRTFLSGTKNKSDISVVYNTNGTFILDSETIELLQQFKSVSFIVSIDAYGSKNDKIRSGSQWGNILEFIDQLEKCQFDFSIHSVIHLNNFLDIFELEQWVNSKKYLWTTNILTYPQHLDIDNASDADKQKFLALIENSDIPNKDYIKEHISE